MGRAGHPAPEAIAPPPPSAGEWLRATGVALGVALLFSWPLLPNLHRAIPAGSEPATVALFQLYTLEWTGRVLDGEGSYWDAPFFHPHEGTFAWSEPQPFTGVLAWLIGKLLGGVLAYNLIWLGYVVGAAVAAYGIARLLTEDRLAALLPLAWIAGGAYTIQQAGVLHLVAMPFPIGCLGLVLSAGVRGGAWRPGLAALLYLLTFLTCLQYGVFLTLLLPLAGLPGLRRGRPTPKAALVAGLPWLAAAGLLLPVLLAQKRRLDALGLVRSLSDVRGVFYLEDLFLPAKGHWLTSRLLGWGERVDLYSWDVGIAATLLVLLALAWPRSRPWWRRLPRGAGAGLVLVGVAALILGFGPRLGVEVGGRSVGPYAVLHATVPGLDGVRSPARLGLFVTLAVACLAAPALAALRRGGPRAGLRRGITLAAAVLLGAEMLAVPIPLAEPRGSPVQEALVDGLRALPRDGALLEIPMARGDRPVDLEPEVHAMRRGLRHGLPVANGYSGHFPAPYRQLRRASWEEPGGRLLRYAAALGVRRLVLAPAAERALRGTLAATLGEAARETVAGHGVWTLPPPSTDGIEAALPVEARLPRPPAEGEILGVRLPGPATRATLLQAGEGRRLAVTWKAAGGEASREIDLRGSVIVDRGQDRVWVRLVRFSEGDGGLARLLPHEEVPRPGGR